MELDVDNNLRQNPYSVIECSLQRSEGEVCVEDLAKIQEDEQNVIELSYPICQTRIQAIADILLFIYSAFETL